MTTTEYVERIESALKLARSALDALGPLSEVKEKSNGDPVTLADTTINEVLLDALPIEGEGWLSEETVDSPQRLNRELVWIVDPLDGTKEYVMGIPEWCISIGLVENGVPIAGGILCPPEDQLILGARGLGVTLNGKPVAASPTRQLAGETVLASRSEINRGEWDRFEGMPFSVRTMGSVAYKMARVAAGLDAMTWTLVPKNEWDVAAGAALVLAAGGCVIGMDGGCPVFNQPNTLLPGLIAIAPGVESEVRRMLEIPAP